MNHSDDPFPRPDLEGVKNRFRLFVTTYGQGGRSGTVPVNFLVHEGRVYFTTRKASVKARRIRKGPRVTVRFGSRDAKPFDGRAAWVEDMALYDFILARWRRKYWFLWWVMGRGIRRRKESGESTAIEITFEGG